MTRVGSNAHSIGFSKIAISLSLYFHRRGMHFFPEIQLQVDATVRIVVHVIFSGQICTLYISGQNRLKLTQNGHKQTKMSRAYQNSPNGPKLTQNGPKPTKMTK